MRYISFLFFILICLGISSEQAFSKNPKRRIYGDEIKAKMFDIDRTFWGYKKIDRYYFKTDGTLQHQVNEPKGNIPQGTVLDAKYYVENDSLCWDYSDDAVNTYGFTGEPLCFDLFTRETKEEFMIGNHPEIRLKTVGSTAEDRWILRFFSWHRGDYIYDPKYVPAVYQGMINMALYRERYKGNIPNGYIERDKMQSYMKQYYDIAIGNVFAIDRDYMYFLPNGDYYWIDGPRIDAAKGDLDKMVEAATKGTWNIKDNIHCWRSSTGSVSSCEFVFPPRKGLKNRTFNHFLGTFHTGMTRIHNDGVEHVRHLPPDQTELPELFERFRKISGY